MTLVKLPVSDAVYDYIKEAVTKRGAPDLVMDNYINMSEIALVREIKPSQANPRCCACNGTGYLRTNHILGKPLIRCGCVEA